jgi:O-antigen/teichoic acid export membrane protein
MKPIVMVTRLIEPEIALAFGAARHDLVRKLFTRSCQITLWAVLPACIALWFGGETLYHLWTRGQINMDAPLYALLLLASAANSMWYTALMVPYATNRHERIAVLYAAIYGSGVLILSIPLMRYFQSSGSGFALLVGELAMTAVVLPIAIRLSGDSGYNWLRTVTRPPVFLFSGKNIRT